MECLSKCGSGRINISSFFLDISTVKYIINLQTFQIMNKLFH